MYVKIQKYAFSSLVLLILFFPIICSIFVQAKSPETVTEACQMPFKVS